MGEGPLASVTRDTAPRVRPEALEAQPESGFRENMLGR